MEIFNLNVGFVEDEFKKLRDKKGSKTWHDFILTLLDDEEDDEEASEVAIIA